MSQQLFVLWFSGCKELVGTFEECRDYNAEYLKGKGKIMPESKPKRLKPDEREYAWG